MRAVVRGSAGTLVLAALWGVQPIVGQEVSQPAAAAPNKERTFVGTTKCAACHFAQYKVWSKSAHGKAFEDLPAKYRADVECLKCHTTGFGHESGYKDAKTPNLAGISCEACHGPGSEHTRLALRFVDEGITDEGEKRLRESIARTSMQQCIQCHWAQAHKEHPKFDRDEEASDDSEDADTSDENTTSQHEPSRSQSFFSFKSH